MKYYWNPYIDIQEQGNYHLFINPNNGSWLKVKPKVKKLIDGFVNEADISYIPKHISENLIERFIKAGILVSDKEIPHNYNKEKKYIKSIYFVTTRKCNMECSFCSMNSGPNVEEPGQMDMAQIQRMAEALKPYDIRTIIITGGEPLVRNDIVEVIDCLKNTLESNLILSSNGLLLDKKIIGKIAGKISRVEISLENIFVVGAESDRDTLIENIEALKEHHVQIAFSYVMTKCNRQNIFDFIDMAVKYEADISIKIVAPFKGNRDIENLFMTEEEILKAYKELYEYIYQKGYEQRNIQDMIKLNLIPGRSCSAKERILSIYPDGNVYPCHSLNYPEFYLGNVISDGFDYVIEKQKEKQLSGLFAKYFDVDNRTECKSCGIRYFCKGACMSEVYGNKKREGILPPDCGIKMALINFNLWNYRPERKFSDNMRTLIDSLGQSLQNIASEK